MNTEFDLKGFQLQRGAFEEQSISQIKNELLSVGNLIEQGNTFDSLDVAWNHYKESNRSKASLLYNGFKFIPSIKMLATSDRMTFLLKNICGIQKPALVDINCRIDSSGEDKFLFSWHQDFWFSVCSTKAVVVWIPVMGLDPLIGGLELISNEHTNGRIFKARPGNNYNSYADAILMDEPLPAVEPMTVDNMDVGDALFFSFSLLHRSLPVTDKRRSRFTVQLRFADFADEEFIGENYRPGAVSSTTVDYLRKGNA